MPRRSKRQADGSRTPWYSPAREAAHMEAAATVRRVGGWNSQSGWPALAVDALAYEYFERSGFTLRVKYDADGSAWFKCAIQGTDGQNYYLLCRKNKHEGYFTGFVNLCEKIEEMFRRLIKPSLDVYRP